ncbi:NAD-dependent epimerase/dehydratase family protein [Candidatus Micrarchaeota archaeon]|nr:NAD-dependent epimerase/dehydratase family protein [Candidatus Micrarchaeota archaeon]
MKKIFVTGATGQIGSELVPELRKKYGRDNVIMGLFDKQPEGDLADGPSEKCDVRDKKKIEEIVREYGVGSIIHLSSILSATGEQNPQLAFDVNMKGLYNVLEVSKEQSIEKLIYPSSIAVFGPDTPKENTPNETILRPSTMYGITKVAGELLGNYYFEKFGLDVRGLRYPGIISWKTPPGGGTTDYAVAIYYEAIKQKKYTCFVREDTMLPMMYMPDAIKALMDLAEAKLGNLKHHADYNLGAMSFTAGELAESIKQEIPGFTCTYEPDFRQKIADSWPKSIDDSAARKEWGWKPEYDLTAMTKDMLKNLKEKLKEEK